MIEVNNLIIGSTIIILNLVPLIYEKYKYLILTGLLSALLILMLKGGF